MTDNYHEINIQITGAKGVIPELCDEIEQAIEHWKGTRGEDVKEIDEISTHVEYHTKMSAVVIERGAVKDYIDQVEWSHIVDVIANNGELHEYATLLGKTCFEMGDQHDCSEEGELEQCLKACDLCKKTDHVVKDDMDECSVCLKDLCRMCAVHPQVGDDPDETVCYCLEHEPKGDEDNA